MYDQDPLVSGTIRRRVDAFTGSDHYRFTIDGIGYDGHWAHDTRRLLDENARLNAELAEAANTITAPAKQLAEIGAMVGYPDPLGIADAVRAELAARDASIAALSERCTAKGLELDRVIREAAADKARVSAVRDVITPKNPDWKPLSERYPEHFTPDTPEEAARKKGWGQGVELLTQRIKAALDDPAAAPEMPRPPAEEAALEYRCRECDCWAPWTDGELADDNDGVALFWCQNCSAEMRLDSMDSRPQEPASGSEMPGTGSGRGTGVAEASGTAQEFEWPDVDGWTIHLRAGGGLIVTHDTGAYTPVLMSSDSLSVGAVLAFIAHQQPEEDDETEPDLSLIPADLITSEPGIRGGEPCITGTRIPAHEVAGYLADGATWDEVREMLPSLPSLPVPSTEEGSR